MTIATVTLLNQVVIMAALQLLMQPDSDAYRLLSDQIELSKKVLMEVHDAA